LVEKAADATYGELLAEKLQASADQKNLYFTMLRQVLKECGTLLDVGDLLKLERLVTTQRDETALKEKSKSVKGIDLDEDFRHKPAEAASVAQLPEEPANDFDF